MTNNNAKDLIISALEESRLAALHIDIQSCFNRANQCTPIYLGVNKHAQFMRDINVPNIWVTYPWKFLPKEITTVQSYNDKCLRYDDQISFYAGALDNETVSIKSHLSAMTEIMQTHLQELGKDTLLISGVSGPQCIRASIRDAIFADQYDVVAITDCISLPDEMEIEKTCARKPSLFQQHYFTATSEEVRETFSAPAKMLQANPELSL